MRWVVGIVVVAFAASACGGGRDRIDANAAARLAQRADAVAAALERGDGCAAAREARVLRGAVAAAIRRDEVPQRFRQPLRSTVASLARRIVCRPPVAAPPPPPPPPAAHGDEDENGDNGKGDEGKGGGRGHGKGRGKDKR